MSARPSAGKAIPTDVHVNQVPKVKASGPPAGPPSADGAGRDVALARFATDGSSTPGAAALPLEHLLDHHGLIVERIARAEHERHLSLTGVSGEFLEERAF